MKLIITSIAVMVILFCFLLGCLFFLEKGIQIKAPFLKNYVETILEKTLKGHSATFQTLEISTSEVLSNIQLEFNDFNLSKNKSRDSLNLSKVKINFSLLDFLSGSNNIYDITINSIPISIEQFHDKSIVVSLDRYKLFSSSAKNFGFKRNLNFLKGITVTNPNVILYDHISKTKVNLKIGEINISKLSSDFGFTGKTSIKQYKKEDATIHITELQNLESSKTLIKARFENLIPSNILDLHEKKISALKSYIVPISGTIQLELSSNAEIKSGLGTIKFGSTDILGNRFFDREIQIIESSFNYYFKSPFKKINLYNILIDSNLFSGSGSAEVTIEKHPKIKLSMSKLKISKDILFVQPVSLVDANFDIELNFTKKLLTLNKVLVSHDKARLFAKGALFFKDSFPKNSYLNLQFLNLQLKNIPLFYKQKLQQSKNLELIKILDEITMVKNFNISFNLFGNKNSKWFYKAFGSFEELKLKNSNYAKEISIKKGDFHMDLEAIKVSLDAIIINLKDDTKIHFKNTDIFVDNPLSDPILTAKGDFKLYINELNSLVNKTNNNKYHYITDILSKFKLQSEITPLYGSASLKLNNFDINSFVSSDMNAILKLDNFNLIVPKINKPLMIHKLDINLTPNDLISNISASIGDAQILASFKKVFIADMSSSLQITATPKLSDFKSYLDEYLIYSGDGNIPIALEVIFPPKATPVYRLKADISNLSLKIPLLGFSKNRFDSGELGVGWTQNTPLNVQFSSNGYQVSALTYLKDNKITRVDFKNIKLGQYFIGQGSYQVRDSEDILTLQDSVFHYFNTPKYKTSKFKKPLKIIVGFKKLHISPEVSLDNFEGSFLFDRTFNGSGVGDLNSGPLLNLNLKITPNTTYIKGYSDNAGSVLLKSKMYSSGYGGQINFEFFKKRGFANEGNVHITNLQVIGAPFLAKLVALTSIDGILEVLTSNGVVFDEIKVKYSIDKNFLYINQGFATNSSFGLTLSGQRNMNTKVINYEGVMSPVYSLNGIVKKIPLIGKIIGGNEGEGAFGVKYFANGFFKNPHISVNPLSIITPGVMRDLLK